MQPLIYSGSIYAILYWIANCWWIPEAIGGSIQGRKRQRKIASRQDRGSLFVLMGSMFLSLALGFALAYLVPTAAISWNQPLWVSLAVVLILLGAALRWYAMSILGRYFTHDVAGSAEQPVIQRGPYRYIRHPAYSGTLLVMMGIGLGMTNWLSLVVVLLGFCIGHLYRVRIEEQTLVSTIGQPYREYMHHTKRLIPFIY